MTGEFEGLICVIDDHTFLIGRPCSSETFSIRQRLVIADYFPRSQTSAGSSARSRTREISVRASMRYNCQIAKKDAENA